MRSNLTTSDIFDVNKSTGGLILGKNRLDDYASKYLSRVCKEALVTPMPLPVEQILADEHLTVIEVSLSKSLDIFGCCLLLDGDVQVYNKETGSMEIRHFPAGTILIDSGYAELYGEGAKRNTLVHEILHWEKDKRYFEILQLKNRNAAEKLYPIMCRQSETNFLPAEGKKTKENEVRWLEWQAHRLAPRILMPKETFRRKALGLISDFKNTNSKSLCCDVLIGELSEFFQVSRASVKYRLQEVDLLENLAEFEDYEVVYAELNESKDYQELDPVDAFTLSTKDAVLRNWVKGGRFIYADGYFVLANPKYVVFQEGVPHLTAVAKRNLKQCVINIRAQLFVEYRNAYQDLDCCAYLCKGKVEDVDRRIYLFNPKLQNLKFDELDVDESYTAVANSLGNYDEEEEKQLLKMLGDPDTSLCQCLWFLMERRKWKAPATFVERTGLHDNYHGKIKNDKYNKMGTNVLMAICVGLKLRSRMVEKLFGKSRNKLDYYRNPDKTYIDILDRLPGLPINDFNGLLKASGLNELKTLKRDDET